VDCPTAEEEGGRQRSLTRRLPNRPDLWLAFGSYRSEGESGRRVMEKGTTLRVARPTDHLEEVVRFYTDGLGLFRLGSFEDHDGFDGVMLGVPGAAYHLEFTRKRGHASGPAPTQDNLLVFYLPDRDTWQRAVDRMIAAGYHPVPSFNPYWDRVGRTFEDSDGYRAVLQNAPWPP
jgi:catechol 2,3-dioxygenase-like lactoylglutathione lyase family enzyme